MKDEGGTGRGELEDARARARVRAEERAEREQPRRASHARAERLRNGEEARAEHGRPSAAASESASLVTSATEIVQVPSAFAASPPSRALAERSSPSRALEERRAERAAQTLPAQLSGARLPLWLAAVSLPCADAPSRAAVGAFIAAHASSRLHVLANVFDGVARDGADGEAASCASQLRAAGARLVSHVAGFKPLFWREVNFGWSLMAADDHR